MRGSMVSHEAPSKPRTTTLVWLRPSGEQDNGANVLMIVTTTSPVAIVR